MLAPPHKSHIVVLGWRYTLIKVFNSEDETYTLSCKVLGYIHYMSELSHALHATRNPSSFPRLHAWGRIQHLVHKWPMRFQKCHYQGTSLINPMIESTSSASLDQWVLLPTLENTHWRADHESQHINDLFNAQAMLQYGLRQGTHSHLPFLDAVFVYCKKMGMSIPPKYIEYFRTTIHWCTS